MFDEFFTIQILDGTQTNMVQVCESSTIDQSHVYH